MATANLKKDHYVMLYVRKVNGTNSVVWKKKLKQGTRSVSFQKKTYIIDYNKVIYRKANTYVLMLDLDGEQLMVQGQESLVSPELIDSILRRHLGSQIVNGLTQGFAANIVQIILGVAIGLPIGIIVSPYILGA